MESSKTRRDMEKTMFKLRISALLCALTLLLSGCAQTGSGDYSFEEMTETMEYSMAEGHFFFAGKILSAGTNDQMITYYDVEAETNTVYQVQVTEDFFGCMPEEPVTVCIYGTTSNFVARSNLEKGKEYLFDTTLWVQGEEVIFLLPSFYEGMPERAGETLYYTVSGQTALVDGTFSDYKAYLTGLAAEQGYGPERVRAGMIAFLEEAAQKDVAFFEERSFTDLDQTHLTLTAATAAALLEQTKNTAADWTALEGLLK